MLRYTYLRMGVCGGAAPNTVLVNVSGALHVERRETDGAIDIAAAARSEE
jgi:hypothetical protein